LCPTEEIGREEVEKGMGVGREDSEMGRLTLGKRPARMAWEFVTTYKKPPFQVRGLFSAEINRNIAYNIVICVSSIKRKYSCVQVKNRQHIRGTKHVLFMAQWTVRLHNNSNHISQSRMILKSIQRFCRHIWF
jgi:hypothetical protein